jgi:hypothetical protein
MHGGDNKGEIKKTNRARKEEGLDMKKIEKKNFFVEERTFLCLWLGRKPC